MSLEPPSVTCPTTLLVAGSIFHSSAPGAPGGPCVTQTAVSVAVTPAASWGMWIVAATVFVVASIRTRLVASRVMPQTLPAPYASGTAVVAMRAVIWFVAGSSRNTLPSEEPQTDPEPKTSPPSDASGIDSRTRPAASIRTRRSGTPLLVVAPSSQSEPAPYTGRQQPLLSGARMTDSTEFPSGATSLISGPEKSSSNSVPSPNTMSPGSFPTGTCATTVFEDGSM